MKSPMPAAVRRSVREILISPAALWLVALAASIGLLVVVSIEVASLGPITHWDSDVLSRLPRPRGVLGGVFKAARRIADPPLVAVWALMLAACWSLGTHRKRPLILVGGAIVGVSVAIVCLSTLIGRASPESARGTTRLNSYPSGHAAMALAATGAFCLLSWPMLRWWGRTLSLIFSVLVVATVGLAMVSLRSHWPSDIVGGLGVSAVTLTIIGILNHLSTDQAKATPRVAAERACEGESEVREEHA